GPASDSGSTKGSRTVWLPRHSSLVSTLRFHCQFLASHSRERVIESRRDQLGQFLACVLRSPYFLQGLREQPAGLGFKIGAHCQPDGSRQVTGCLSRLLAQAEEFATPEESLALDLVGRESLFPTIHSIQGSSVIADSDELANGIGECTDAS